LSDDTTLKVFYSTGFFIEANFEALRLMVAHSKAQGGVFAFNFASGYLFEERKAEMLEMISEAQYLICNKDEAMDCVKFVHRELGLDQGCQDMKQIAKAIAGEERVVIITDSSRAVIVAEGQECFEVPVDALE
jgi:sugar/nucleoside kinase (ribokinase family)